MWHSSFFPPSMGRPFFHPSYLSSSQFSYDIWPPPPPLGRRGGVFADTLFEFLEHFDLVLDEEDPLGDTYSPIVHRSALVQSFLGWIGVRLTPGGRSSSLRKLVIFCAWSIRGELLTPQVPERAPHPPDFLAPIRLPHRLSRLS